MSEDTSTAVLEKPPLSDARKEAMRANLAKARAARTFKKSKEKHLLGAVKHANNKAAIADRIAQDAQERAAFAEMAAEVATAPKTPEERAVASGVLPEEDFGSIVQVGVEGRSNGLSLGKFSAPSGFDMQKYAIAWGALEAGTLEAFSSIAELQQPKMIEGTDIMFPGWRIYRDANAKMFSFKKGNGELVMLYTLREHWTKINAATSSISKKRGKAVEQKMLASNSVLPAEVREQQLREEEQERAALLQLQRMAQMQSTS